MTDIIDSTAIEQPAGQLSLWDQAMARQPSAVFQHRRLLSRDSEFNKYSLLGVPFVITGITYQPGDEETGSFVSLECTIAPYSAIDANARASRIPGSGTADHWIEAYKVQPLEEIVLNDGGKGIKRQITKQLHNAGLIVVHPDARADRDFDLDWQSWTSYSQSETRVDKNDAEYTVPHFTVDQHGQPLLMVAMHGLRASKDPDAPASHSDTFYLS